jgi:hypothetical protein
MTSSTPQSALTAARPPSVTTSSTGQSTPVVRRTRHRDRTCGRSRRPSTSSASAGDASSRADASAGATRIVCESRPSAGSTSVDGCSVFVSSRSWLTRHLPSRPGLKFTMMMSWVAGSVRNPRRLYAPEIRPSHEIETQRGARVAAGTIRYWAGARAAAGIHEEPYEGDTLGAVLDAAASAHGTELARVFTVATFLLDGSRSGRDAR